MPREGFRILSVDQDFQSLNAGHIRAQRLRDGIHGQLFAENSGRSSGLHFIREIGDARAVRLNVERQAAWRPRAACGAPAPEP